MAPVARAAFWPFLLVSAIVVIAPGYGCAVGASSDGATLLQWDAATGSGGGMGTSTLADANACRPGDVGTFQPSDYHPASAAWQGVCRPDLISGFYDACLGALATTLTCKTFTLDAAAARCAACILTPDTATHYGPLIDHDGAFITTNVAGCIELTDSSGLSCAKAVQALAGCELFACEANCPVTDSASLMIYNVCVDEADQGGCQSYAGFATCIAGEDDAGFVGDCLIPTFADFYAAVAPLFCGAPQVDASVAPFDAAADVVPAASADAMAGFPDAAQSGDARTNPRQPPSDAASE